MAFVYFHGLTGVPKEKAWVNILTNSITKEMPSERDMIYDIILSHSKIEKDISEIYLLLNDSKNQKKDPIKNKITEKRLKKYMSGHKFKNTLNALSNKHTIKKKAIIKDLEKMTDLRNDIAHGHYIDELFNREKIMRIIFDSGENLEIDLGEQNQITLSDTSFMQEHFKTYTMLCQKYSKFFFSGLSDKISFLKGDKQ